MKGTSTAEIMNSVLGDKNFGCFCAFTTVSGGNLIAGRTCMCASQTFANTLFYTTWGTFNKLQFEANMNCLGFDIKRSK